MSVVAGMVRGNLALLQATAVTDRWGATHYGHLSGLLAAPATTAAALARFAGAALTAPLDGYGRLFFLLATVSAARTCRCTQRLGVRLQRRPGNLREAPWCSQAA
ncbi:hypothetical protein [Streptomyces pharetrae]|uniref:hypothetical protein n=1 Tax=Streptomyces pharetrae TaxID=291370 RepID=UPI003D9F4932